MKSVFDTSTREELVKRINSLGPQSSAQWGKMDTFQMLKHCTLCEDMWLGKTKIKRALLGRLFGSMVLKKILKDDRPFGKNSPTSAMLRTTSLTGDVEMQKREWVNRIQQYAEYNISEFVHPFFGTMNKEQVGIFAYKHADHHLRQFGS